MHISVHSINKHWAILFLLDVFLSIWWVEPFSTDFYSSFLYVVLLHHCPSVGIPLTCLTRHIIYVCACPKSGACNLVVVVCYCVTYFFLSFICTLIRQLVFSLELFYIFHSRAFYSWLCGMGFAQYWRPYSDL